LIKYFTGPWGQFIFFLKSTPVVHTIIRHVWVIIHLYLFQSWNSIRKYSAESVFCFSWNTKFYVISTYIWGFLIGSAHLYNVHRKYWQEILFPSLNYACKWRISLFHEVLSSLQMGIIRIIQRTWYSFIDVKHIRTRTINQ
jgi:hypothetical protein